MAEVVGFLREDSTYGEKKVLDLLRQNLPKEYTVYVETPVHKKREIRYPDFIILTNYGLIVIEVKDWVTVEKADPSGATIRTRNGYSRFEPNPVNTAREYAIVLANELNTKRNLGQPGEAIPWSYAVVLINLPTSVVTQLRKPWGEEFVLGRADLENQDVLLNRIKMTFPSKRMRPLTKAELDLVRATIYPVVEIDLEGRPAFVLDEQQEKIVAEPVYQEAELLGKKARRAEQGRRQERLFEEIQKFEEEEALPPEGERISQNVSVRLLRGFSGSGKTLVLMQRARFLAAQYPEWKIGVLTYNRLLQQQLERAFKGTSIKPQTFHSLCFRWMNVSDEMEAKLKDWLNEHRTDFPILQKFDHELVEAEIDWLRDMGIVDREDYLAIERKGIGKNRRLLSEDRNLLFDVYEAYRSFLAENNRWDWPEIPLLTLQSMEKNSQKIELFDAILIDEAQDWAPVWFKVINRLLDPNHGVIFLADDPSQSIYRYFSWKEKGIDVVGRTRWLKVPYRNTYEIYRAAYSLIANHPEIQRSLAEEGEIIKPEISKEAMRHGPIPLIRRCQSAQHELATIRNSVDYLKHEGFPENQIAVLLRYHRDMDSVQKALRGSGVEAYPIHGFKGLEMEAVIIPHLQNTFLNKSEETSERRLVYMAMSRARTRLYLTYSGKLPLAFEEMRRHGLADFVV